MKTNKGVKGLGKKLKVAIISVAVCLALAVGGAISALVISNQKGGLNPALSGTVADPVSAPGASTAFGKLPGGSSYYYTDGGTDANYTLSKISVTVNAAATWGSNTNPYVIRNKGDWQLLINVINNATAAPTGATGYASASYYIDAGGVLDFSGTSDLVPVGSTNTRRFSGKLYGGMTVFKNITFNMVSNIGGLFGYTNNAEIRDITIDSTCKTKFTNNAVNNFGAVIYTATGSALVNVSSKVSINHKNTSTGLTGSYATSYGGRIGGLVGYTDGSFYMNGCSYAGTMEIWGNSNTTTQPQDNNADVAGWVAYSNSSPVTVANCSVDFTGVLNCLGLVGASGMEIRRSGATVTIKNIFGKDNVTMTNCNTADWGELFCIYGGGTSELAINAASKIDNVYYVCGNQGARNTGASNALYKNATGPLVVSGANVHVPTTATASVQTKSTAGEVVAAAPSSVTANISISNDGTPTSKNEAGSATATYNISYALGSERASWSQMSAAPKTYQTRSTIQNISQLGTTPTRSGFTFMRWSLTPNGVAPATANNSIPANKSGNITFYAVWGIAAPTGGGVRTDRTDNTITYGDGDVKLTASITHSATSEAGSSIKYEWQNASNAALAGATNTNTYTLKNLTATTGTVYKCKMTLTSADGYSITYTPTVTVIVNKKTVVKPKFATTNGTNTVTYTYNGKDQTVAQYDNSAADAALYTVTGKTQKNAGSHTLTVRLNDTTNYKWSDISGQGANASANYTPSWTINKATPTVVFNAVDKEAYVGQPYSAIRLNSSTAVVNLTGEEGGETAVPGAFAWKTPNEKIKNGTEFNEEYNFTSTAVFTPTDTTNYATVERAVSATVLQLYVIPIEIGIDTEHTRKEGKIPVDYGSTFTPRFIQQGEGDNVSFTTVADYVINGETQTGEIVFAGYSGYGAVMGTTFDAEEKPAGTVNLANITDLTNRTFYVGYTAQPTKYTVYHVMQSASGSYPTVDQIHASSSTSKTVVKEELHDRATDSWVYTQTLAKSNGTFEGFSLDTAATENTRVQLKGDGTTEFIIYYARQSYTVTFLASRATTRRSQTKSFLFEEKIVLRDAEHGGTGTKDIRDPEMSYNNFIGWYEDEALTKAVNFDESKGDVPTMPGGNVTYYAKFEATQYKIHFLMNIAGSEKYDPDDIRNGGSATFGRNDQPDGTAAYQLDRDNLGIMGINENYSWDTSALFDGAFAEQNRFADNENDTFTLSYDTTVITSSKSLKNVVPAALGYRFNGWLEYVDGEWVEANGIDRINRNTAVTRIFVASWTPLNYTIRFNTMGGSVMTGISRQNGTAWAPNGNVAGAIPTTIPTRTGYKFVGWAPTEADAERGVNDNGRPVGNFVATVSRNSENETVVSTSGGAFGRNFLIYNFMAGSYGYDRDTTAITLYAIWESQDVTVKVDDNFQTEKYGTVSFTKGETPIEGDVTVKVGDEITVRAVPNPGYEMNRISVNGVYNAAGVFTFTVSAFDGAEIVVFPEFSLIRYSITYNVNGGTSTDSNIVRSYNVESSNLRLPSLLTKRGYDFKGWEFTLRSGDAFTTTSTKANLYGETLIFSHGNILDNVILSAKWEAQDAPVYLYNVTYTDGSYDKENASDTFYTLRERLDDYGTNSVNIKTGDRIEIINPVRQSFDFIGWATRENGSVVYPAGENKTVISNRERTTTTYTVNADHDINDRPLNANRLFAVWHVHGVERINMTVDGNNGVYGSEVKMSASPETKYGEDEDSDITLTYMWYLVIPGTVVVDGVTVNRYDLCFVDEEFHVINNNIGYYVDADGNTVGKYRVENNVKVLVEDRDMFPEDGGNEGVGVLTYKKFNPAAAAGRTDEVTSAHGCRAVLDRPVEVKADGVNINDYTIANVNDSGLYICYVTASGDNTNASGYGEIEAILQKATHSGLDFDGNDLPYNAAAQKIEVSIDDSANGSVRDSVITLPDESRVRVTYIYTLGETEVAAEDVKDVGTYRVVASFSWITNNGNYEDLTRREAELTISPREINSIAFVMNHKGEESTNFSVGYDGEEYAVSAVINDKFSIDPTAPTVAEIDGIEPELNVYKIVTAGAEHIEGATVDAGSYYVLVTGITGEKAGNYTLGNFTKRRDYTINKATRDVSNITFADVDAVFDNSIHNVEIKLADGYSLPEGVEFTYEKTDYVPEDPNFTQREGNVYKWYNKNDAPENGGYYAGVYTITAKFTDENSNYEPIADMTAKLTIAKQDFFKFYDKEAMLTNAGFKSETYGYLTDANYVPYVSSGDLFSGDIANGVSLSYDYYKYASADLSGTRTPFLSVTQAEAMAHAALTGENAADDPDYISGISESGLYAIVINFEYVDNVKFGMLFSNNLNLPTEEERTIYYEIAEGVVSGIEINLDTSVFDRDNVAFGSEFLVSNIGSIVVDYGTGGKTPISYAQYPDRIANVQIDYDVDGTAGLHNTFWHVGEFKVKFTFYGVDKTETFYVKQSIEEVTVQYSEDGGNTWKSAANAQLSADAAYKFQIMYFAYDENGNRISKTTAVKDAALVHGKNVLEAEAENYYTFENADISVQVYTTVNTVAWEYSSDGENWTSLTDDITNLPYIGKEYQVRAVFEIDGVTHSSNATAGNAGLINAAAYNLTVLTEDNYIVTATREITVDKIVAEFNWSSSELKFNAQEQSPVATPRNMMAADLENLTIRYRFTDVNGEPLTAAQVIRAGEYNVHVVLSGSDSVLLNNYTLTGSGSASLRFEIKKADVEMTATYDEANYGEGKTYFKNPHGLRTSALKANFTGAEVDGTFTFIYDLTYDSDGKASFKTFEKEEDIAELLTEGKVYIDYAFTPTNSDDYNTKYGQVELDVLGQESRKGNNSLTVELGTGAYSYYLVNQTFSTVGIEVYREYNSFYIEGAGSRRRTYGRRDRLESGVNFSIEGKRGQADGTPITATDLAGGKVTLIATAIDGSNGRRDFEVIDSRPTAIRLPNNLDKTYYVGQFFDYSKEAADGSETVLFEVSFQNGEVVNMTKGDVKSDYDGYQFLESDAGKTLTVTFEAFGGEVSATYQITVQPQEELFDSNNPHNGVLVFDDEVTVVLPEDGSAIPVPVITYNVDGVPSDELDGVSYVTLVNGRAASVIPNAVGEYEVTYAFTVTNPRFKRTQSTVTINVRVSEEKYTYEFTEPTQKEFTYTGNVIAASNADGALVRVWDLTNPDRTIPASRIKVEYLVDGVVYKTIERGQEHLDMEKWTVRDVIHDGTKTEYRIDVRVYVAEDGEGFGDYIRLVSTSYSIKVTPAGNRATLTPSKNFVIVGNDTDLRSIFSAGADFSDSDTAYFQYKKDGETSFTRGLPEITDANAGKYQIRYYVPATSNYAEAAALADIEIRRQSLKDESNGNDIEIIDGAYGIGADVRLQTSKVQTEDLEAISIRRQNVLDGYDVNLVSGDTVVQPNGNVTVRVKLGAEFADRTDLNVYLYGEDGRATRLDAQVEDGYLVFTASRLGRIAITETVAGAPVGLIAGVSVGAVVAAALIVACVLVFLKKRGN